MASAIDSVSTDGGANPARRKQIVLAAVVGGLGGLLTSLLIVIVKAFADYPGALENASEDTARLFVGGQLAVQVLVCGPLTCVAGLLAAPLPSLFAARLAARAGQATEQRRLYAMLGTALVVGVVTGAVVTALMYGLSFLLYIAAFSTR